MLKTYWIQGKWLVSGHKAMESFCSTQVIVVDVGRQHKIAVIARRNDVAIFNVAIGWHTAPNIHTHVKATSSTPTIFILKDINNSHPGFAPLKNQQSK